MENLRVRVNSDLVVFARLLAILIVLPVKISAQSEEFATCLTNEGTDSSLTYFPRDPDSPTYDDLNYQWNQHGSHIEPLGYFLPSETRHIQSAVRCGKQLNIRLVPKSGGHSYEKYSFGDSESIVVDLQLLNGVIVDRAELTARVGAGTLVGPLYWNLWINGGLSIPATFNVAVGVGGISQGGGLGIMVKRHGLTLDNVLEVEMVDAEGFLHVAHENADSDLFWALRGGGGGNFGIVTSFKYRLFNATDYNVTSVALNYELNNFQAAFKAWQNWNAGVGRSDPLWTTFSTQPSGFGLWFVSPDFTSASIEELTSLFPPPDNGEVGVKSMNIIEFAGNYSGFSLETPEDLNYMTRRNESMYPYRSKTYFCDKVLSDEEIEILESWLTEMPVPVSISLISFGGLINEVPENATAYVHRNALFLLELTTTAEDSDEETSAWIADFDKVARATMDNGESSQNLIDGELAGEEYLRRYYGTNLERLVQVKSNVDPLNYFHFPQSIPTRFENQKSN